MDPELMPVRGQILGDWSSVADLFHFLNPDVFYSPFFES